MKKISVLIMLWCCASCEDELISQQDPMVGQWEITWTIDGESATGVLQLDHNHLGTIVTGNPLGSTILPGDHQVAVAWERNEDRLTLQRTDNDFALYYNILDESESSLTLAYIDDIRVMLHRMYE